MNAATLNGFRLASIRSLRYAIAGATPTGQAIDERLRGQRIGASFEGYFDDRITSRAGECVPLAGKFEDLVERARHGHIDVVFLALPLEGGDRSAQLIEALADTTASVYLVPDHRAFELLRASFGQIGGIPVMAINDASFTTLDRAAKRLLDVLVACIALLLLGLPMLLIALLVKLSSPGPVIFRQRRHGLNGKVVEVWKFRSMSVCEDGASVQQAQKNDRRITPLGAFLRRTSLDELPQFINVLQGTMSVVGPRPHAVAHNEHYRRFVRGYMLRHKVKPGITGLAQVSGCRGETDTLDKMEQRVRLDLAYVRDWSIWLDIKILFKTLLHGFTGCNAY